LRGSFGPRSLQNALATRVQYECPAGIRPMVTKSISSSLPATTQPVEFIMPTNATTDSEHASGKSRAFAAVLQLSLTSVNSGSIASTSSSAQSAVLPSLSAHADDATKQSVDSAGSTTVRALDSRSSGTQAVPAPSKKSPRNSETISSIAATSAMPLEQRDPNNLASAAFPMVVERSANAASTDFDRTVPSSESAFPNVSPETVLSSTANSEVRSRLNSLADLTAASPTIFSTPDQSAASTTSAQNRGTSAAAVPATNFVATSFPSAVAADGATSPLGLGSTMSEARIDAAPVQETPNSTAGRVTNLIVTEPAAEAGNPSANLLANQFVKRATSPAADLAPQPSALRAQTNGVVAAQNFSAPSAAAQFDATKSSGLNARANQDAVPQSPAALANPSTIPGSAAGAPTAKTIWLANSTTQSDLAHQPVFQQASQPVSRPASQPVSMTNPAATNSASASPVQVSDPRGSTPMGQTKESLPNYPAHALVDAPFADPRASTRVPAVVSSPASSSAQLKSDSAPSVATSATISVPAKILPSLDTTANSLGAAPVARAEDANPSANATAGSISFLAQNHTGTSADELKLVVTNVATLPPTSELVAASNPAKLDANASPPPAAAIRLAAFAGAHSEPVLTSGRIQAMLDAISASSLSTAPQPSVANPASDAPIAMNAATESATAATLPTVLLDPSPKLPSHSEMATSALSHSAPSAASAAPPAPQALPLSHAALDPQSLAVNSGAITTAPKQVASRTSLVNQDVVGNLVTARTAPPTDPSATPPATRNADSSAGSSKSSERSTASASDRAASAPIPAATDGSFVAPLAEVPPPAAAGESWTSNGLTSASVAPDAIETASAIDPSASSDSASQDSDGGSRNNSGKNSTSRTAASAIDSKASFSSAAPPDAGTAASVKPTPINSSVQTAESSASFLSAPKPLAGDGKTSGHSADPAPRDTNGGASADTLRAENQPAPGMSAAHLTSQMSKSDVKIALQGDQFGSVELHAKVNGDQLSASITVEHHDTHAMLASDLPALHQLLNERQLRVSEILLLHDSLASGHSAHEDGASAKRDGSSPRGTGASGEAGREDVSSASGSVSAERTSGSEIFNSQGRLSVRA
jgi:hypothetical protein